ncbi:MAG: alpha-galactosidase, partial [Clostridia bacterium]|nr:alpha-galactosidase [Clostridia bacterium]
MTFDIKNKGNAEQVVLTRLNDRGPGIEYYKLEVTWKEPSTPEEILIGWDEPMGELEAGWTPTKNPGYPLCYGPHQDSRYCTGAPMCVSIGPGGANYVTVALLDSVIPTKIRFVSDELGRLNTFWTVQLFHAPSDRRTSYSTVLRIDRRSIPWYDAAQQVALWWEEELHTEKKVPDLAETPLYSTWYIYRQNPRQEILERELKKVSELGFRTVILDDGWQFDPEEGLYAYCGDWEPSPVKFPDFAGFVEKVHSYGMKILVWFALPFAGYDSKCYQTFRDKIFDDRYPKLKTALLDIRFPEVRKYLTDLYLRFIRDYKLDGVKLDFLDSYHTSDRSAPFREGMDCESIETATKIMLEEITAVTRSADPDFLVEFREQYFGPEILRNGNIVRNGDCPFDPLRNHFGIANLRLFVRSSAIHSDMMIWSVKETPERGCLNFVHSLFGVPQISVSFLDLPEKHLEMVQAVLRYWEKNKEILLHGHFRASHPELMYTVCSSENEEKR